MRSSRSAVVLRSCLLLLAGCLVSCESEQKRALRALAEAGVEPSGRSLLQAVSGRNTDHAKWLVAAGVHTEHADAGGRTPLRVAIDQGDVAAAFLLLDADADVNASTPDEVSVLGMAVRRGETAICERLIAAGARADGRMPDGEKILPWAIREGRLAFVRLMLRAGADPHLKDVAENPLLHVAIRSGRRDVVETLLELGADPGGLDAAGESTLHLALSRAWHDIVPELVRAGADPNLPGPSGLSPLERAVEEGDRALAALLLECGANPNYRHPRRDGGGMGESSFERVFAGGDREMLEVFLKGSGGPEQAAVDSWLWRSFHAGDVDLARLLLRHGANPRRPRADGFRLSQAAVLAKNGTFLKLLLDYSAVEAKDLYLASAAGDDQIVKLMLAAGLSANLTLVPTFDTPLGVAIRRGHDRVAALLLRGGAQPDLRLPEGQPALHLAVATGCSETVRVLLESGADPNEAFEHPVGPGFIALVRPGVMRWSLKMDRNITPLMLAADSGVVATTRYLLEAGAKKSVWTRVNRMWPINFASRRHDVKMMKVLLGQDPEREERYLVIRLSEQRAQLFDGEGNEVFTTRVSTGRKGYATPTGEFVITNKHRAWTSTIYHASMPYFQRLSCSDFGLHQGVVPGYPASHGCIRVPAGNAAKLFGMTKAGDRVRIIP